NTQFSNLSQAGYGSVLRKGVEGFSELRFDKIYTNGYVDEEDLKYRHAELLYPNEYDISQSLEAILCRNEVEKETLLGLLYETDRNAYYKYKNKIHICKQDLFEKNGLFVDGIRFNDNAINIIFADPYNKIRYFNRVKDRNGVSKLEDITISVTFEWRDNNSAIFAKELEVETDYLMPKPIAIKIPKVEKAKSLVVTMKIENRIMARVKHMLSESEIL
ncbi:MAG: hypothetical protein ACI4WG_06715, partial [Erysipelotrichaceae bacterium]